MDYIIGFITGLGLVIGIYTTIKGDKKLGITQLALTILFPIIISYWCTKKEQFVFGGSDFEFMIQTMTVDKMIEPWLIFILFIVLLILLIINIINVKKINCKKD